MFFLNGWLLPLPLAAIYFGLKALGQIDRMPEEYSGRRLASWHWPGGRAGYFAKRWLIFVGN